MASYHYGECFAISRKQFDSIRINKSRFSADVIIYIKTVKQNYDGLTWKNFLRNYGKSPRKSPRNYNEEGDGQQRVTANLQREW